MQWGSQEEYSSLTRTWPNASPSLRAMHRLVDPICRHCLAFSRRIQISSLLSPTAGAQTSPPGRAALGLGLQRSPVQIPACRTGCPGSNPVSKPLTSQIPHPCDRGPRAWHLTGDTRVFGNSGRRRCPRASNIPGLISRMDPCARTEIR